MSLSLFMQEKVGSSSVCIGTFAKATNIYGHRHRGSVTMIVSKTPGTSLKFSTQWSENTRTTFMNGTKYLIVNMSLLFIIESKYECHD
jgi:hypothetical protein